MRDVPDSLTYGFGMGEEQQPVHAVKVVVGIPSVGRASILPDTVRAIAKQTRLPERVVLSLHSPEDLGELDLEALPFQVDVMYGEKGATRQRNRVFPTMDAQDILLFLDDDFLMAPDYLAELEALFASQPDVVMATGTVLADGIKGPGFDHDTGARKLDELTRAPAVPGAKPTYSAYGCNMAIRMSTAFEHNMEFDEVLPLYSWLEDVDFSRRIAAYGLVVKSGTMRGVHLGTKTGRTPGMRIGYSQIVNPIYLVRKGSLNRVTAIENILRNLASNLIRSVIRPPWADYPGRLRGNLLGIREVLRGTSSPERILTL